MKKFKKGISNLLYYFQIIWKDRQYDHSFIEELQLAKFKKIYKHYTEKKEFIMELVGMEKTLIQPLKICINILERRKNDWYTHVWYEQNYEESKDWCNSEAKYKSDNLNRGLKAFQNSENRDWNNLNEIIKKYQNYWWD